MQSAASAFKQTKCDIACTRDKTHLSAKPSTPHSFNKHTHTHTNTHAHTQILTVNDCADYRATNINSTHQSETHSLLYTLTSKLTAEVTVAALHNSAEDH